MRSLSTTRGHDALLTKSSGGFDRLITQDVILYKYFPERADEIPQAQNGKVPANRSLQVENQAPHRLLLAHLSLQ
jgi:hypothetical protein